MKEGGREGGRKGGREEGFRKRERGDWVEFMMI